MKERMRKMAILQPHTFAFSCLPRSFWALIWVLLITEALFCVHVHIFVFCVSCFVFFLSVITRLYCTVHAFSAFPIQGPLISITIRPLQYNSLFLITRLAPLETSASQTFTSTELVHKLYLKSRGKLRVLFTAHNVYWVRFSYFRHSACWARRWCFWVQP